MRFYGDGDRSPLPIPGDISFRGKYDPIQEEGHREKHGLRPRDMKPPKLSDEEWELIRIKPGEMLEPEPPWDGECKGKCCQAVDNDSQY